MERAVWGAAACVTRSAWRVTGCNASSADPSSRHATRSGLLHQADGTVMWGGAGLESRLREGLACLRFFFALQFWTTDR
jgi:hypothetical protein